jgi:hypothetical protein
MKLELIAFGGGPQQAAGRNFYVDLETHTGKFFLNFILILSSLLLQFIMFS